MSGDRDDGGPEGRRAVGVMESDGRSHGGGRRGHGKVMPEFMAKFMAKLIAECMADFMAGGPAQPN